MTDFAELQARLSLPLDAGLKAERGKESSIYKTLQESDALLKAVIPYFVPPHIRPDLPDTGSLEYGILPYWAQNPEKIPYHKDIPDFVLDFLKKMVSFDLIPKPTINEDDYNILLDAVKAGTAIGPDGTLFGTEPYEQLDYNWLQAVVNALLTKWHYGKASFGDDEPAVLPIMTGEDGKTTLALAGDWGTGDDNALAVRSAIENLNTDYLVHLGDVYYTGTPRSSEAYLYWGKHDEVDNLVDFWPGGLAKGRSFTTNSNHEMYPGGHGLFQDALTSPVFEHQNGKSYFMLFNDDWQIFCLDSAYNSPDFLCMFGALNDEQISFVQSNVDHSKKTILMTHHTPYDLTGQVEQIYDGVSLLKDVKKAFGKLPDYWYFGHIHDGIVYSPKDGCNMRCTGHAAMPYGAPWELTTPGSRPPFGPADYIDGIEFFACSPKNAENPAGQVKNGFMTVTLDGNQIQEAFYDCYGAKTWPC